MWRFRTDPMNEGLAGQWHKPTTDDQGEPWRDLRAGAHWENQAADLQHYTGVAWYRAAIEVPAGFANRTGRIVFEGIDDSATVWLDGEQVAQFGDAATATTVWLQPSICELGTKLTPGKHSLVLRVVDHAGAGGLWKPVYATTGPADASDLLQR
jgi:beta-galactosidase/beta-glucuronidase